LSRVVYQTCTVLKSTPWNEDQWILTLLSRERCLFSALWKRPSRRRLAEDLQPNLFQTLQGVLSFKDDGHHKLRQFEVLQLPPSGELLAYDRLNLMARIFQWLLFEHQGDPQPFALWQKHQHGLRNILDWTDFLADLLLVQGGLPDKIQCSNCKDTDQPGVDTKGVPTCQRCHPRVTPISRDALRWLAHRHKAHRWLAPIPADAKLIEPYLGSCLPEKMWQDPIISKLLLPLRTS